MMNQMPQIHPLPEGGVCWRHAFDSFRVKVLVPPGDPLVGTVNFGFKAPYLLVFEEKEMSMEEALDFAVARGLYEFARAYSASVVFVAPACEGGWEAASPDLFKDLIAESRIHQYYRDGVVTFRDRFTGQWSGYFIRGAIFRTFLYGYGASADYIARHCLKTLQGQYLWGPGEITPAAAVLERLSVVPALERRDIPVVSVGNPDAVNACLRVQCDHLLILPEPDRRRACRDFLIPFKRWCGRLAEEPSLETEGMAEEPGFVTVRTSPDNRGDAAGEEEHRIGYIAYYRRDLTGKAPLLLAFHGGGDSALHIAHVSGWWRVAKKYGFLLVCVEDHLNSTASETMELLDRLKERYPIDSRRIYASGFSMGGCKCWDLYQEYPEAFAALAPMDATFEVGLNVYGQPAPRPINRTHPVPLFYAGGEETPLPELPFQAVKCRDRIAYVFEVNQVAKRYDAPFEARENWENPIWGVSGDRVDKYEDLTRGSVLTVHSFVSRDGETRTALASVSGQGHDCRQHTCDHAWQFMSRFALGETEEET